MAQPEDSKQRDSSSQVHDLEVGTVLEGRYRLTKKLGEGGMGVVFEAVHIRLARPVAVKVMHEEFAAFEFMRTRFDREAKALAALSHSHIVTLTDYGVFSGMPYLVMELLQGQTLRDLLNVQGRLPEEQAFRVTSQILDGLAYAHHRGLIHRDLKPGNIFLESTETHQEEVKILDFGFVKFFAQADKSSGEPLTKSGIAFGTMGYMPPEQLSGGTVGPYSDVYAVGILLYEMLTGYKPFQGEPEEVARHHLVTDVPPFSHYCPEVVPSPEFTECLHQALAKKGRDRYADAGIFLETLQGLPRPIVASDASLVEPAVPAGPAADSSVGSWAAAAAVQRRQRLLWATLAVITCLVGVVLALVLARPDLLDLLATGGGPESSQVGSVHKGATVAPPTGLAVPAVGAIAAADDGGALGDADADGGEGGPDSGAGPDATGLDAADLVGTTLDSATVVYQPGDEASEPALAADAAAATWALEVTDGGEDAALDDTPTSLEASEQDAPFPAAKLPPNPWRRRPVPRVLAYARRTVLRDRSLNSRQMRRLREFLRENRRNPLVHLVLAQSYANGGASSAALERYRLAINFDREARGDPRMLRDLIGLMESQAAGSRSASFLVRTYGMEARDALEQAIKRRDFSTRGRHRARWAYERVTGQPAPREWSPR